MPPDVFSVCLWISTFGGGKYLIPLFMGLLNHTNYLNTL